jgi:tripartite-type tricarboxylate transporter receptor subunit TctC
MGNGWRRRLFSVAAACLAATAGHAEPVADFYKGKTIQVMIGFSAGGGYDNYAREIARHMGKYIPGHPTLVPQNMPGAGSLLLTNYLYNVAPKDGTVFGIIARNMALDPLLGSGTAHYDASKLTWLGSVADEVSVCAVWKTSPVQNWADIAAKPFSLGGEGARAEPDAFANVLKNLFGAQVKLVTGYPGGNDISMAMERGEVDGRCGWSWSSIKGTRMSWLKDGQMKILVQLSLAKAKDMPGDSPLIIDVARTDEQREILKLIFAQQVFAWPFAAPPGLPPERAEALITAFEATMKDQEFAAELGKFGLEINPVSAAKMGRLIAELYQAPKNVIEGAKQALQ